MLWLTPSTAFRVAGAASTAAYDPAVEVIRFASSVNLFPAPRARHNDPWPCSPRQGDGPTSASGQRVSRQLFPKPDTSSVAAAIVPNKMSTVAWFPAPTATPSVAVNGRVSPVKRSLSSVFSAPIRRTPKRPRPAPARPQNAATIRAMHRQGMVSALDNDDSPWALCQGQPGRLASIVGEASLVAAQSKKPSVRANENAAVKWWVDACEYLDTPWLRDDPAHSPAHPDHARWLYRETLLTEQVVIFISKRMKGRAAGVGSAQISSVTSTLGRARTVLGESGGHILPNVHIRTILNGLIIAHVKRHGQLPVQQTQPWPRDDLLSMLSVEEGQMCGNDKVQWSSIKWHMLPLALSLTVCAGFRKVAITIMDSDDPTLMMDAVEFYHDGKRVAVTAESAKNFSFGRTMISVRPPAGDKTDYTGRTYGSRLMWFHYDPADPLNIGYWMVRREIRLPVFGAERRNTPVLTPNGCTAYTGSQLDALLRPWQLMVMTPSAADRTSWHSGRVTLASGLGLDLQPPSRIMELCRWSAEASVATYKRLDAMQYADAVRSALRHNAVTLPSVKRVVTDDDEAIARLVAETTDKGDATPQARPPANHAGSGGKPKVPKRSYTPSAATQQQTASSEAASSEAMRRHKTSRNYRPSAGNQRQKASSEAASSEAMRQHNASAATEQRSKRACKRAEALEARQQG